MGNLMKQTNGGDSPWNELDKVFVESDASTSIEDWGVGVTVEVCGDDLQESKRSHWWETPAKRIAEKLQPSEDLVVGVSQNALHGSISSSFHDLLNVVVLGLWRQETAVSKLKIQVWIAWIFNELIELNLLQTPLKSQIRTIVFFYKMTLSIWSPIWRSVCLHKTFNKFSSKKHIHRQFFINLHLPHIHFKTRLIIACACEKLKLGAVLRSEHKNCKDNFFRID